MAGAVESEDRRHAGQWDGWATMSDALGGVRPCNEFQTGLYIARRMLATRLRDLAERGILKTERASYISGYGEQICADGEGEGPFPLYHRSMTDSFRVAAVRLSCGDR